ncbi:hypothetical protein F383_00021 [Gossypium arboreum]|uniref:Uncharacterized protein n=1 Tax=Gossypium arboreum TaxID=29729 RepID=A0A0B0P1X6_GOSAR|nr:hypothetical protein F383_00021 [Gossypium arboreum]
MRTSVEVNLCNLISM